MRSFRPSRHLLKAAAGLAVFLAALWQMSAAFADSPAPSPLGPSTNPVLAPIPGVNITTPGQAAGMHGDPVAGRAKFVTACASCHAQLGAGNVPNPGSTDGTIPALNPIDPGFLGDAKGNPATFARDLDLFIQHGSRPAGDHPQLSMVGFGDQKVLPQADIADIEAYVMQLNGMYWSDRWAPPVQVQEQAVRSDGDVTYITYRIMVTNQSAGPLSSLYLRQVLPQGTSYITSFVPGPDQNPAKLTNNVLEWNNEKGIPQGGTFGPFTVVVQVQDPKAAVAPTNAWASFTWVGWDGTSYPSSAASDLTSPAPASH